LVPVTMHEVTFCVVQTRWWSGLISRAKVLP
jgi:hypothetical protein